MLRRWWAQRKKGSRRPRVQELKEEMGTHGGLSAPGWGVGTGVLTLVGHQVPRSAPSSWDNAFIFCPSLVPGHLISYFPWGPLPQGAFTLSNQYLLQGAPSL